jgi:hypothetical protein
VREDVVGVNDVRDRAPLPQLLRQRAGEERGPGRDPRGDGDLDHVLRRVDPENRDTPVAIVLQQVSVVARDLDDEVTGAEGALGDHAGDEEPGVLDHRRGP